MSYKVVCMYFNENKSNRTIERGLTLEEAQAMCGSDEGSSRTATSKNAKARTRRNGPWFFGYSLDK